MWEQILPGLRIKIFMTVVLGIAYPLAMTGISQLLFPKQANGSLITAGDKVIGSEIIGQFAPGAWVQRRHQHRADRLRFAFAGFAPLVSPPRRLGQWLAHESFRAELGGALWRVDGLSLVLDRGRCGL